MKQKSKDGNLRQVKAELERRLVVMRYSEVSAKAYMRIFGWVEDYLNGYGEVDYSKEAGQRFLAEYSLQPENRASQFKNARTVIRRLDEILENKIFTPCFRKSVIACPPRFADCLANYLEYLEKCEFRKSTIECRKRYAKQLFARLPDTVLSADKITATDLYGVFTKHEWPETSFVVARSLLTFLFEKGITKVNLSLCTPRPRRRQTLPSIYTGAEVERLLSSVDRTTILGRRDYAMLMLAAHLGLRSSDIVNLSFKDIDHSAKVIKIVQVKTARPLTLVMNSDVEETILDYVQNCRPKSSSDKVFLGSQAPYAPLTAGSGYAVAKKYFNQSGIATQGRQMGTHALRASYATALIGKGVPYVVVQESLGHEDPESSKYYVRVDIRRLRECALNVPKPTGSFALMLDDLEGVM